MAPASNSPEARTTKTMATARSRRLSCSSRFASCRWIWSGSKKSQLLMPVNCASWSITTSQISASAGNAPCWVSSDPCFITGLHRCVNRRCGSWPGSMCSTWRIPAAGVAGWRSTWLEKGFRSAAIDYETSCGGWVCGLSTRNHAPRFQETHRSDCPCLLDLKQAMTVDQNWAIDTPTSPCRGVSSTWWRSWICSPGTC